jgi:hypothetical protein
MRSNKEGINPIQTGFAILHYCYIIDIIMRREENETISNNGR